MSTFWGQKYYIRDNNLFFCASLFICPWHWVPLRSEIWHGPRRRRRPISLALFVLQTRRRDFLFFPAIKPSVYAGKRTRWEKGGGGGEGRSRKRGCSPRLPGEGWSASSSSFGNEKTLKWKIGESSASIGKSFCPGQHMERDRGEEGIARAGAVQVCREKDKVHHLSLSKLDDAKTFQSKVERRSTPIDIK